MRFLCRAPAPPPPPPPPPPRAALAAFRLLRVVGKGATARVRIVEARATARTYALKYVDKAKAARRGAAPSLLQERRLLEEIHHPFLVNMYYAFQDDVNCYLVLDLMLGGTLQFHRLRRGSLGELAVRFYVAEISSALAYLHQLGICHRDVKPDNILLDVHGHAHLSDFNAATRFSEQHFDSAVAGTMLYMAPEMLARTGYSWQVDYWALGVTAYECLFFGARPFAGATRDAAQVAAAILHAALAFPADAARACSPEGRAALAALLDRDAGARLGCAGWSRRGGQTQLRAHAWFRGLDWARLAARQLAPPFQPDAQAHNFEDVDDASALRRSVHRLSHVSAQAGAAQRMLAERFAPYDFEQRPRRARGT